MRTAARLRLALLRGALRSGPGSTARRAGFAIGAVFGGAGSVLVLLTLTLTRGHGDLPTDASVVLFTGMLLGWVVLPILTFGSDDLLDPARLALLPLTGRQLLTVMGVGALIGVAPVATVIATIGLVPATGTGPASDLVAVIAVGLLLALCVSASRACVAALSGLLRSRRGRDLGVALAALVGLSFQLINPLVQVTLRSGSGGQNALHRVARPLRWTPPGLLAEAPSRSLPAGIGSLLLVAVVVLVLLLLWQRSVRRSLERAEVSGTRRRRGTALAPRLIPVPAGRVGAVMAKDLRYLMREPRRLVGTVTGLLVPVLGATLGPIAISGGRPPGGLVFAVCGVGVFGGLVAANRFGLDGTATWMLISSSTDPRDARRDLLGGDLAMTVVTVPAMLLLAPVLAVITGGWVYVAPALGLAIALQAIGVAISGLIAVRAPYAIPPSQNAFGGGGGGQGCTAGLLTLVAMASTVLLCLPLLALVVLMLVFSWIWGIALFVLGPVYGLALGDLVRRIAARAWSERGPEVLAVLTSGRG